MTWTLLGVFDLIGTIAFAIAGAIVAVRHKMDLFGINVLAICTATGGGMVRDLIIGQVPPAMFRNPFYVVVAALTANIVFLVIRQHHSLPRRVSELYDHVLFWFDTLGLAAFTVDGVMAGIRAGYGDNLFLIVFLGLVTGVGGGILRDVLADQVPDVLRKHVYAISSIAGAIVMGLIVSHAGWEVAGMVAGAAAAVCLRFLAAHYEWNLPRIE